MTGIYGNSQEDKIHDRALDKHTEKDTYTYENESIKAAIDVNHYKFPEFLNNNLNFTLLVKGLSHLDLSKFVYYVGIMADEKEECDTRNWARDSLNVFLNQIVKELGKK